MGDRSDYTHPMPRLDDIGARSANGWDLDATVSGGRPDTRTLFAQAMEKVARRQACPRHHFPDAPRRVGEKLVCAHCGVDMRMDHVTLNLEGYAAAGGDPEDVALWRKPTP